MINFNFDFNNNDEFIIFKKCMIKLLKKNYIHRNYDNELYDYLKISDNKLKINKALSLIGLTLYEDNESFQRKENEKDCELFDNIRDKGKINQMKCLILLNKIYSDKKKEDKNGIVLTTLSEITEYYLLHFKDDKNNKIQKITENLKELKKYNLIDFKNSSMEKEKDPDKIEITIFSNILFGKGFEFWEEKASEFSDIEGDNNV